MDGKNSDQKLDQPIQLSGVRKQLNSLFFDTQSRAGRIVNNLMLAMIMVAVTASMLNTVDEYHKAWGDWIGQLEHWLLIGFAIEYTLRIYSARNRWHYMRSFNGLVDLITVLPLFIVGDSFVLIRLLRLVRVIRVAISFPIVRALFTSLKGSLALLMGVLGTIGLISILVGNMIYILEPKTFSNAFEGTWWSLVTMSTVGYGDFVPHSALGKSIAAGLIMSGICMFAMITAVISVRVGRMVNNVAKCGNCGHGISQDFPYCPHCGTEQTQMPSVNSEQDCFSNQADDL